ncbi:MAG: hypothetical protein K0R51_1751 [Cytophagaceae bacterium]|jgi:hypothetical protein|nr:hypothetical protein [Cytophagaceae bacterium]
MFKMAVKVVLLLLAGVSTAWAQPQSLDSLDIKKRYRPWVTYTSLRFETLFKEGSSVYAEYGTMLEFQGLERISQDEYYSLNENYSSFLWLGYEHAFTEHWYAGASGKINFVQQGDGSFFNRFNIAHRGHISKLFFYKEVAFEYLSYAGDTYRQEEGRFSPSIGLGRQLKIKDKPLYIGVNYRAFVNFDFKNDNSSLYDKRKLDRTKLKGEISYGFLPHWYLSVYYLRDTEYYCACGGDPAYKVNQITEGVGFTLTYLLFKENSDKYVTDLPVR